jgi:hypothetical protein
VRSSRNTLWRPCSGETRFIPAPQKFWLVDKAELSSPEGLGNGWYGVADYLVKGWPCPTAEMPGAVTILAFPVLDRMILHLPIIIALDGIELMLSQLIYWPVTFISAFTGMIPTMVLLILIYAYIFFRGEDGFGTGDLWL